MRKKFLLSFVLILSVAFLAGCASAGNDSINNQSNQKLSQKIINGQTTEAQIKHIFGDPYKQTFNDNGDPLWTYQYKHEHRTVASYIPVVGLFAKDVKGHKKTLVILFSKKGIVKNWSFSSSAISARAGL